ncbi:MAG: ATP-binding protein [Pleurocapsa minor GSE-CHR-MK-17-07R]|nr:ATP-binding protein [Pleurocapsa minor GSE-CHR-MK 17-07R]
MNRELSLDAAFEALEALSEFLNDAVMPCESRTLYQVKLAVHELCMNIVQHAYAGEAGVIVLSVERERLSLSLEIRDFARRGLEVSLTGKAPDPFDLPESGWGMPIVHRVMDTVVYHRLADGNQWLLSKKMDS